MASRVPNQAARDEIDAKVGALVQALEAHPQWTPPTPPPGIYYTWDFVNRSKYINSEIGNILEGKNVKYPDQFSSDTRDVDPQKFAERAFDDVVSRASTATMLIQDPSKLMLLGLSQIDFGDNVRAKAREASEAILKAKSGI